MYDYEEKIGDYRALCQRCGFKYWASDMSQEWNGLYVCKKCWEPRHPLDFQRGKEDDTSVPWTSPDDGEGRGTTVEISNSHATYVHAEGSNDHLYQVNSLDADRFINFYGDAPQSTDQVTVYRADDNGEYTFRVNAPIIGLDGGFFYMTAPGQTAIFRGRNGSWYLAELYNTGL